MKKLLTIKEVADKYKDNIKIEVHASVVSYLKRKGPKFISKVAHKLDYVIQNPSKLDSLQGYKGLYRFRMDDYRIIIYLKYNPKAMKLEIIGNRKSVYKELGRR